MSVERSKLHDNRSAIKFDSSGEAFLAPTLSVKEFADATGRFPNQIYDLINKGNQFRKLECLLDENGKKRVPKREIEHFPFTPMDKLRIELEARVSTLEGQVSDLERFLVI